MWRSSVDATHAIEELGVRAVDVNEDNTQAVGFYERLGFVQVGRSELDGQGKPYPTLHMKLSCRGVRAAAPISTPEWP